MGATITGFDKIQDVFRKEIQKVKVRSVGGLLQGAAIIRRDMDITPPLIPLDLGNLRASWFVASFISGSNIVPVFKGEKGGIMSAEHSRTVEEAKAKTKIGNDGLLQVIAGFSANYAIYLHEDMMSKNYNRPGSGPKFLESSMLRNKEKVLIAAGKKARIK